MSVFPIRWIRCLSVCLLSLIVIDSTLAQSKRPVEIKAISIGFPVGDSSRWRIGDWNPIYVQLQAGKDNLDPREYQLETQSVDADGAAGRFRSAFPSMQAGETRIALTYAYVGNASGTVTVRVIHNGRAVQTLTKTAPANGVVEPSETLVLTLQARATVLQKALEEAKKPNQDNFEMDRFAHIDRVDFLPDRWFGYEGVDVVILPTSKDFTEALLEDKIRFQALVEWVHRGGRLLMFVGRNYQTVTSLPGFKQLINCQITGTSIIPQLVNVRNWASTAVNQVAMERVEVAAIKPGPGAVVLVSEGKPETPIVLQSPAGRGRVLLVGFDFDSGPFTKWSAQPDFWKKTHEILKPKRPSKQTDPRFRDDYGGQQELGSELQRGMEQFDEVPVISFGWIALFILIYILIVGPVEYIILKKVFKKMEWTWITFPVVVILISVGAYFTAYAIKGNDLRINKVDIVDVDLYQGDVQGTSWITLFSPRMQSWTLGLEPVWGESSSEDISGKVLMTTLSPPDNSIGGVNRPGGGSFFKSPYEFAEGGRGLTNVPIPVWAARSFTATWSKPATAQSLFEFDLKRAADNPKLIIGTLTSKLPVTLRDVSIFYKGSWYDELPNLPPNVPLRIGVQSLQLGAFQKNNTNQWLKSEYRPLHGRGASVDVNQNNSYDFSGSVALPNELMKSILFHSHPSDPRSALDNSGLHGLDQGWRLEPVKAYSKEGSRRYLDEILVIGRVSLPSKSSEEATMDNASATRLWLGELPASGKERPTIPGFLAQETYVRIFIPVPSEKTQSND